MTALFGFVWQRPHALWLLAMPIFVLFFARFLARPAPEATGTLAFWRRAGARAARSGARTRARIPPAIMALALALALAVLALAQPSPSRGAVRVRMIVDRSPSMYLPELGATRLARALASAREALGDVGGEHIEWLAPPADSAFGVVGREPPSAWLAAPRVPRSEPDFDAYDARACVWITDRTPAHPPREASVYASGGERVVGPIALVRDAPGDVLVEWDGERLHSSPSALPRARIAVAGVLPASIREIVAAWAAARGVQVIERARVDVEKDDGVALTISSGASDVERERAVARDGWFARARAGGTVPASDSDGALDVWLESGSDVLVGAGPGRIVTTLTTLDVSSGDPAAFAVSWARLLDLELLPPPTCVSVAERAGAGASVALRASGGLAPKRHESSSLPAVLAVLATISAAVAGWLGSNGSFARKPRHAH